MNPRRTWLVIAAFSSATHAMAAPCVTENPCAKQTAWTTTFNTFEIKVSGSQPGDYGHWHAAFASSTGDTKIDVDQLEKGKRTQGILAMVSGRTMITKGLALEPGYEIDAVDGPFLLINLTMQLLGHAFPNGPESITEAQRVNLTEAKDGLHASTPSASADFAPPWTIVGTVNKEMAGAVQFDLRFTSSGPPGAKPPTFTIQLAGSLSHAATDPSLDDSMSLVGWKVYGVGPRSEKEGNSTILDYGATEDNKGYKTIADVRKAIAEEMNPGAPDQRMDFTGFWKSKCEDNFGLQIMHFGTDGMYSIAFCGPGGCGTIDEARKTFITGDKHFEVVSEDELIEIRSSGERDRNIRCTKEPHPVLK